MQDLSEYLDNYRVCPVCGDWNELDHCLDIGTINNSMRVGTCGFCPDHKINNFIHTVQEEARKELDKGVKAMTYKIEEVR